MKGMSVIAHPYAGTPESDSLAHEHAVALAAISGSRLLSLHADAGELGLAPARAADLLRGWGRDPASVEHELRVHESHDDPVNTVLELLRAVEADLVVMATAQHRGALRALLESRAEAIAAGLKVPALMFPVTGRGFVDERGQVSLSRIVVPVGDPASAAVEIERTGWFVDFVRAENVEVELLHVAAAGARSPVGDLPEHPHITWTQRRVDGALHETILEASAAADLLVMATRGHDSLRDLILGSHTERVLRRLDRPLLLVPLA